MSQSHSFYAMRVTINSKINEILRAILGRMSIFIDNINLNPQTIIYSPNSQIIGAFPTKSQQPPWVISASPVKFSFRNKICQSRQLLSTNTMLIQFKMLCSISNTSIFADNDIYACTICSWHSFLL